MLTARYRQRPTDLIRYVISLHNWLADAETILEVASEQDSEEFDVENVIVLQPDAKSFQFYLGGGVAGSMYEVQFVSTTSQGQQRTDVVQLMVGD